MESKILDMESKILEMESRLNDTNKKVGGLKDTDPEFLDNIWDLLYDTEGNEYYLNKATDESSWVLPDGARLRNRRSAPPLPPRVTSPITVHERSEHYGDTDDIPDLFGKSVIVPFTYKPKNTHVTDLLSDSNSYASKESAKIYPSKVSPRKTSDLPYEEQIKLAMIESLSPATG